jgi:hypothetical protein
VLANISIPRVGAGFGVGVGVRVVEGCRLVVATHVMYRLQ